MLADQGVLQRSNGGWAAREVPAGFAIPDSVQSLLASRIDLLGQAEKETLQAAAVMGRTFRTSRLSDLLEGAAPALRILEERDFVRRLPASAAGDEQYAFKHALTREVAYAGLSKAKRAHRHAAFAGRLEAGGEARDENAPLLAHHYAEAANPDYADLAWPGEDERLQDLRERAVAWLRRAAELAIARYALDEAVVLLRRALVLDPSEAGQVELWRMIGRASVLNFDGESFWNALLRAADVSHDPATVAAVYADLAIETATRSGMWKGRPDNDVVDGWIEQALALAPPSSAARAKALAASSYLHADAGKAAAEAVDIAERLGDQELRSFAVDGLTTTAIASREYHDAYGWAELRLTIARGLGDPDHLAEALLSGIGAYLTVGRIREARQLARDLEEVSAELTPHHRLHAVGYALVIDVLEGRWDAVHALRQRTEQAVVANEANPCVLNDWSLVTCATASVHAAGDDQEARRLEHAASGMLVSTSLVPTARVGLALARGDLAAVAELLPADPPPRGGRPSLDAYLGPARLDALAALHDRERVEREAPEQLRRGTFFEPFALRALGIVRRDSGLIEEALSRFEAMELGWHVERTSELLTAR